MVKVCVFGMLKCVYISGCILVKPIGSGSEELRCWVGQFQSDTQVFGVILVGLLGLRNHKLSWTTWVGFGRAVVLSHFSCYKIVIVLFVYRVARSELEWGDGSSQAVGSELRIRGATPADTAPIPLDHIGRASPQQ